MARKKAKKEVSRKEVNGNIIITFDDGSVQIIPAPIDLTAEEAAAIFGSEEEDEEADTVVILRVEALDDDTEAFNGVDDDRILNAVFEIFKERFKDEFNFVD